jgi:hypothetical protein
MPLPPINDTQYIDARSGLIAPWFTKPFLEELYTWDLRTKRVFEYGCGHSTIWWTTQVMELIAVDCDERWTEDIYRELAFNVIQGANVVTLKCRPVIAGEVELKSRYVNAIYEEEGQFDIIVIDGSYRDECIAAALTKIKDGGIIICDNWDQEGVWDSIMGGRLLDPWEAHLYIEPSRTNDVRPWKTGYWIIQKMRCWGMGNYFPTDYLLNVTDSFNSHRPMLWMALEHIKPGRVVEFGCGWGSTPLLHRYCMLQGRDFASWETDRDWSVKMDNLTRHVRSYFDWNPEMSISLLFIDSAPGEERAKLVEYYRNRAVVLVIHDTEPEAEYVYHLQETLASFPYRCDLVIEGYPQTTAVSMTYDFARWKGVTLGKYKFV